MNPNILITGGAGFIGSALIWALNQKGKDNILVSDYLSNDERFKNLIPLDFFDYIEADSLLEKINSNDALLKNIDVIYHLGACSSTTETNGRYLIQNNYEYTKTVAHWALSNNKRFIYASSAATYGDGSQGMEDDHALLHKLCPLNMYGYSKHLFDLYAHKKGWLKDIVGLKYFNIFGPNENHKADMRSLVHKAFGQIQTQGKVSLFKSYRNDYKDGEQKRDFLYVKDAVAMTIHLAESRVGGIFNIGSGIAHTWLDLVSAIFKALNKDNNIEFIDMPDLLRSKYQYYTIANINKLISTGYKNPSHQNTLTLPLEDSVGEYVKEYLIPYRFLGTDHKK